MRKLKYVFLQLFMILVLSITVCSCGRKHQFVEDEDTVVDNAENSSEIINDGKSVDFEEECDNYIRSLFCMALNWGAMCYDDVQCLVSYDADNDKVIYSELDISEYVPTLTSKTDSMYMHDSMSKDFVESMSDNLEMLSVDAKIVAADMLLDGIIMSKSNDSDNTCTYSLDDGSYIITLRYDENTNKVSMVDFDV